MNAEEKLEKLKEQYRSFIPKFTDIVSSKEVDVLIRVEATLTLVQRFFANFEQIVFVLPTDTACSEKVGDK